MQLEAWAANRMVNEMAAMLAGGYVVVHDAAGKRLARCDFADDAFAEPLEGAIAANPFKPGQAEADGVPARFEAFDFDDTRVLAGTAGYREDLPAPEMKFRTRLLVKDADVLIDSFVFSLAMTTGGGE